MQINDVQVIEGGARFYIEKSSPADTYSCLQSSLESEYDHVVKYAKNIDFHSAVSMGFKLNSPHLYGLPERESIFYLNETSKSEPYRLFNQDYYMH